MFAGRPLAPPSPTSSCMSMKSNQSKELPLQFRGLTDVKEEAASLAPTCTSNYSDPSVDQAMKPEDRDSYTDLLMVDHLRCSECVRMLKEPVTIPCGHSFCKTCIQTYWCKPVHAGSFPCPQCRKRFNTRPVLNPNYVLANVVQTLQQAKFSPVLPAQSLAGAGDVVCDICTGKPFRAVKSCLTCCASYCGAHVKHHYTVPALQRHKLTEATGDLKQKICQEHDRALEMLSNTDQYLSVIEGLTGHEVDEDLFDVHET